MIKCYFCDRTLSCDNTLYIDKWYTELSSDKGNLVIKVKEVEIVKEVKRSDSLWHFAWGDVYTFGADNFNYFDDGRTHGGCLHMW